MGLYLLFKALHIISFTAWMSALLYMPRLFAYHCRAEAGSVMDDTFKTMEIRLLRIIMNTGMILTVTFGLALIWQVGAASLGLWFHIKMFLVLLLLCLHALLAKYRRDFYYGRNTKSARYYIIINEVPAFILIGIVLLAVLKPW